MNKAVWFFTELISQLPEEEFDNLGEQERRDMMKEYRERNPDDSITDDDLSAAWSKAHLNVAYP